MTEDPGGSRVLGEGSPASRCALKNAYGALGDDNTNPRSFPFVNYGRIAVNVVVFLVELSQFRALKLVCRDRIRRAGTVREEKTAALQLGRHDQRIHQRLQLLSP